MTALILAVWWGHTEVVKLLIKNGADVYAKNKYGQTALMLAEKRGHTKIISILKKAMEKKR